LSFATSSLRVETKDKSTPFAVSDFAVINRSSNFSHSSSVDWLEFLRLEYSTRRRKKMQSRRISSLLVITLLMLASAVSAATITPQASDKVSGKYVGLAKSPSIGDIPITVNLTNTNGKITGSVDTPNGPAAITSGTFADGKLMMKLDAGGNEITINAKIDGDKITGDWELAGQTGTLELKREGAMMEPKPATPATPSAPAAAGDPVSGEWDAAADAGGQSLPFTLKLKLEGENVTGSSESQMGNAPLSKGSYKGDKLSFTLDTPNGAIVFTATLKDGKLAGDYDFAGQATGKWEAKKK
jgi:hypothetical protein